MMEFNITIHKRNPNYELLIIISPSVTKRYTDKEIIQHLADVRQKLDKMIPGSYRVKFNLTYKELILSMRVEGYNQAHSLQAEMQGYIRDALRQLQLLSNAGNLK
jgi:hypothetical protein